MISWRCLFFNIFNKSLLKYLQLKHFLFKNYEISSYKTCRLKVTDDAAHYFEIFPSAVWYYWNGQLRVRSLDNADICQRFPNPEYLRTEVATQTKEVKFFIFFVFRWLWNCAELLFAAHVNLRDGTWPVLVCVYSCVCWLVCVNHRGLLFPVWLGVWQPGERCHAYENMQEWAWNQGQAWKTM